MKSPVGGGNGKAEAAVSAGDDQPETDLREFVLDVLDKPSSVLTDKVKLQRLAVVKRDNPEIWHGELRCAFKHGMLKDLNDRIKALQRAERPYLRAVQAGEQPPDAPNPAVQIGGQVLRIGRKTVVRKNGAIWLEETRVDPSTGDRTVGLMPVTNWDLEIERIVRQVDEQKVSYEGHLVCGPRRVSISFTSDDLAEPRNLRAVLLRFMPCGLMTSPEHLQLVAQAVSFFSADAHQVSGVSALGYVNADTCVFPSVLIRCGEIVVNTEFPCALSGLAEIYDLAQGTDEQATTASLTLLEALDVHDRSVTLPLLATCLVAPQLSRCDWHRFALYLQGAYESGKTTAARVFCNLFADISLVPGSPGMIWAGSTSTGMQLQLHALRDVPAIVDDVKVETVDMAHIFKMLQCMHDGTDKSRGQKDMTLRKEFAARGLVILTGEEIPAHVASSLSRMLVLSVEAGKLNIKMVQELEGHRRLWPILTARFIAWTQRQKRAELAELNSIEFASTGNRSERFARQCLAALRNFLRFLVDEFPTWESRKLELQALFREAKKVFAAVVEHTMLRTTAQRKQEVFVQGLAALLASNLAYIDEPSGPHPVIAKTRMIRLPDGGRGLVLDVIQDTAVNAVNKLTGAKLTKYELGRLMAESGYLHSVESNRPSVHARIDGQAQRVWRLRSELVLSKGEIDRLIAVLAPRWDWREDEPCGRLPDESAR